MAAAAKVFSNSYSHPKKPRDVSYVCVYWASSEHPSCDLFSFRTVYKSGASSFKVLSPWQTRTTPQQKLQNFLSWPPKWFSDHPFSSLSILIHIQPPDWFFYTIFALWLLYPKPPLFSFSQDSRILLLMSFPTWPLLFSKLTLCDLPLNPFLCSDWVCPSLFLLLVSIHSVLCIWKTSGVSQSPSRRQDSRHSKFLQMKGLYRGVVSIWGAQRGDWCPPPAQQEGENRHLEEGLPDKSPVAKSGEDGAAAAEQGSRGRTKPGSPATCCWRAFH